MSSKYDANLNDMSGTYPPDTGAFWRNLMFDHYLEAHPEADPLEVSDEDLEAHAATLSTWPTTAGPITLPDYSVYDPLKYGRAEWEEIQKVRAALVAAGKAAA